MNRWLLPATWKDEPGQGSVLASPEWVHFLVGPGLKILEDLGQLFHDLGKLVNNHVIWLIWLRVSLKLQRHPTGPRGPVPTELGCSHQDPPDTDLHVSGL